MSAPVIACCEWFWRVSPTHRWEEFTEQHGRELAECRASLGDRILTVWLPRGAVIRLRVSRGRVASPMSDTYYHRYGRDRDNRIVIKLRPWAPPYTWPMRGGSAS